MSKTRTIEFEYHGRVKLVVAQEFIAEQRLACLVVSELKRLSEAHDDDEAFLEAVLRAGLRDHIRTTLCEIVEGPEGVRGTVSPVKFRRIDKFRIKRDRSAPEGVSALAIEVVQDAIPN